MEVTSKYGGHLTISESDAYLIGPHGAVIEPSWKVQTQQTILNQILLIPTPPITA